ncbi:unnamed protein product [Pleuronectes platessa]|uniref:Uncharacterized protein n=1 Tax=Pleuronectes platessa TaxID=8262 RepID=A0A9N7YJQ1_PLEPL|nr:unnamed protein product [Pleuronectes platessa]
MAPEVMLFVWGSGVVPISVKKALLGLIPTRRRTQGSSPQPRPGQPPPPDGTLSSFPGQPWHHPAPLRLPPSSLRGILYTLSSGTSSSSPHTLLPSGPLTRTGAPRRRKGAPAPRSRSGSGGFACVGYISISGGTIQRGPPPRFHPGTISPPPLTGMEASVPSH